MKNLTMYNIGLLVFFFFSILSFFFSLLIFVKEFTLFIEWELLTFNSISIVMTLLIDWMSLLFMSFVFLISSMVVFYSDEYMHEEKFKQRFFILVYLFILSMILLIISPNLISILLGWDGLGLISYCLVIYYQNVKSYNAGMLTILSNRIGDVALLMAIAWMLNYGGWNFIFYIDFKYLDLEMKIIMFFILLSALTKSAQIPFSSWLPAAMAAPTPVSALVHSSTLVTAGVYLLIRFNTLLINNIFNQYLLLIGGLTMFMAGLGANFEFDLKKIIALSTLSQLGLMMMILSLGYSELAFFHLLTHAMFKSLLFLSAGSIIHNMMNSQDIRLMGGLILNMPFTSSFLMIANLSLCGMPFLAGFYSKDLILEMGSYSYLNLMIFFFFFFSTGLTVSYSFRLIYYLLSGDFNLISLHPMNDEGWLMLKSMLFLVVMSMISGSLLFWLMLPIPIIVFIPLHLKMLTLIICLIGGIFGYLISLTSLYFFNKSIYFYKSINFLSLMWFMPFLSTTFIIKLPLNYTSHLNLIDSGWNEMFIPSLIKFYLNLSTEFYQKIHNNSLKLYLLSFFLWFMFFMIYFLINLI